MTFEVAPKSDFRITYDNAWLHCLTLEYNGHKDWRLPTSAEYAVEHNTLSLCWYEDDPANDSFVTEWFVVPVRDA